MGSNPTLSAILGLLEPSVAGALPRDFALYNTTTTVELHKAIAYFGLVVYYKFILYNIGYRTMSTFEHPQQSHTPERASIKPTPPERNEREETQINVVSGIGSTACNSCEYYEKDIQPEALDASEASIDTFDRAGQTAIETEAVDQATKVGGIAWAARQLAKKLRKSDTTDTLQYFITSKSASDGSTIEVPLPTDLYKEVQSKRKFFQKRVEYLRAQIASHEKLLDYLSDYTHANIDTGEMADKRGAMINLQFEIMGTIRGLEAKLVEVQYGGSLYVVDSSIVG